LSSRGPLTDPLKLVGQMFDDRYLVETVIGRGGMGVVYKADHEGSSQTVALKVLYRQFAEREHQLKRFSLELKACSKLHHPNAVRVLDYGRSATGYLFIAMEYLKGETLAALLRRERTIPRRRIVRICTQICDALDGAHSKGIVHRDLKPDNVFLSVQAGEPDFVRLLDFGVAKITDGEPGKESYTQTGFICGTPRYISPEQSLGKSLDGRADLYSLGVMLFEMVTGAPLFRADSPIALVMKHVHDAPPVLEDVNPKVQVVPELRALIYQLLEKHSSRRPGSARVVAGLLESIGEAPPDKPAVAPPIVRAGSGLKRSHSSPGQRRQSTTWSLEDTSPGFQVWAEPNTEWTDSADSKLDVGDATQVLSLADVVSQIERIGGSLDEWANDDDSVPEPFALGQIEKSAGIGRSRFGGAGLALGLIVLLAFGTMIGLLWTSGKDAAEALDAAEAPDAAEASSAPTKMPSAMARIRPSEQARSRLAEQAKSRPAERGEKRPIRLLVKTSESSARQAAAAPRVADAPIPSFVVIDSVPSASIVVIRGQIVGQTPFRFQPTPDTGATTIIISRDGYLPESWHYVPGTTPPTGQTDVKLVLPPLPSVSSPPTAAPPEIQGSSTRKKRRNVKKRGKGKVRWKEF
jgi:serine/threonine protein kinase